MGAIVGGTTGAVIGGGVGDSLDDDYRDGRVVVEGRIAVGDIVGDDIRLRRIAGEPGYGYFRAEGQVYVVDLDTRAVVDIQRG